MFEYLRPTLQRTLSDLDSDHADSDQMRDSRYTGSKCPTTSRINLQLMRAVDIEY